MKITVIDNYDSFVYNLCDYFERLGAEVKVYRNDLKSADEIIAEGPEGVLISPGPGSPDGAGVSVGLIRKLPGTIPLLGVCLGHQSLAAAFGGKIVRAEKIMHGKVSEILHDGRDVFYSIKSPFSATRYHSLIVDRGSLPPVFEVSAETPEKEIMAIRHRKLPFYGVQFHPESIITESGIDIVRNFLNLVRKEKEARGVS